MFIHIKNDELYYNIIHYNTIMATHVKLQFINNEILSLSTSSFLFKNSKLLQSFDIEEDNNIPILCYRSYITDEDNTFVFEDKHDLSFMFTLQSNKFLEVCKFLDIICYENVDILYSKQFIMYVMTNLKEEINIIKYFMKDEIRSIINYLNECNDKVVDVFKENGIPSLNLQIKSCTPTFYMLYLTKYKEEVIKYNRIDIYKLSLNKDDYFIYIYKYNNHLTYFVKETQGYKFFIKVFMYNINNYLFNACKISNNLNNIKELVEQGANINMRNNRGKTVLHYASKQKNNLEVIQYIIEQNALLNELKCTTVEYVNIQDNRGKTALHHAVKKFNNLNVVKYLIEKGADIHLKNIVGNTALHFASKHIDNTLDITQKENNNLETIQYLIGLGANIHLQNKYGCTVLHYAVKIRNNLKVIKYLVEQGANIHLQTNIGRTALHYVSSQSNNEDVINYLQNIMHK